MVEKITMYGGEGTELLKKVRKSNLKKMSEKEVIEASKSVIEDAKSYGVRTTLKDVRELTGIPQNITGE
jgi:hypothetical protein